MNEIISSPENLKRAEAAVAPLLDWYDGHKRDLPWRKNPHSYRVWISEIMLQQTRVSAVIGYYERFMKELPDIESLAAVDDDRLMKLWQGLGYYSRARNLKKAARQIMERYGGVFPSDVKEIGSLCGIGEYTAGAVASIALGLPVAAVDGNVLRVVSRLICDKTEVSSRKESYGKLIEAVMPRDRTGDFTQSLMELGAVVCLPNGKPLCDRCPVSALCLAYQYSMTDIIPVLPPKKARKTENRHVWLLIRDNRILLRKRPARGLLAGLWEFPSAPEGEAIPDLAGLTLSDERPGPEAEHVFTHLNWRMRSTIARYRGEAPTGYVEASAEELSCVYSVPSAYAVYLKRAGELIL